jgi:hypothetical protein
VADSRRRSVVLMLPTQVPARHLRIAGLVCRSTLLVRTPAVIEHGAAYKRSRR